MPNNSQQDIVIAIIAGTILFLLLAGFIVVFVLMYQKRRQQHTLEMTTLKQTYDRELLKSQLEIQEQTFRIISQEIHDNIGQVLSLAKLNMGILGQQPGHAPMLNDTRDLLGKAINDLRDLSKSLSPERVADIDMSESISYELQMLQNTGLYKASLQVQGSVYPLPKEKKTILFRIFQEVINNVVKHSGATQLKVAMDYAPGLFELAITDNGKGFDIAQQTNNTLGGIGLRNMQNRSSLIGATCHIRSDSVSGTTVRIFLPAAHLESGT